MHPLRHVCAALALVVPAAFTGAEAGAQSSERLLLVSVLDGDGAPVTGLAASDFRIREDDAAREVLRAEPAGAGRQIALLVDTSEAAVRAASDFRRGLSAFVDGMQGDNRIAIVTFGGPPRILVETTGDPERLRSGIDRVFPQSGQAAYLLDAMHEVSEGFIRRRAERPVLVAVTAESLDDYSNRSGREVLERIDESGAAVYTLSVGARRAAAFGTHTLQLQFERDLVLARGAADSGGRHRDLLVSSALEGAMRELVAELRNQYLVVYSRPDLLVPPEQVRVRVDRPGLTARGTLLRSGEIRGR